jgi:cysteine desulfuration protein SufE
MTLPHSAQIALQAFSACQGWEQPERCEANRVSGCESQVWLVVELQGEHWQLRASSDARLLRGLLALLLARVNDLGAMDMAQVDLPGWFSQLGLARHLSPSRSNGLQAVLTRMQALLAVADQGCSSH